MIENTKDLSQFGYIELKEAGRLLSTLRTDNDKTQYIGDGVNVEFNPNSGKVFLVDNEYNVAMMNGNNLEDWFNCPYCGHEGFKEDMQHTPKDEECTEYLKQIGVIEDDRLKDNNENPYKQE